VATGFGSAVGTGVSVAVGLDSATEVLVGFEAIIEVGVIIDAVEAEGSTPGSVSRD